MTQSTGNINLQAYFLDRFKTMEDGLNGKAKTPFHKVRQNAIQTLKSTGFPEKHTENYKYTPITRALSKTIETSTDATLPANLDEKIRSLRFGSLDAYHLVFINGEFSEKHSTISDLVEGLQILDLKTAHNTDPNLIAPYFAKFANVESDAFTALNTAFTEDGLVVTLDKNVIVEKPILINFIATGGPTKEAIQPRNLIVAGENSQLTLVENYISLGNNNTFTNAVTELAIDKHAIVDFYKLEVEGENAFHVGNTQAYQLDNSVFNTTTISLEGAMVRNNLNVVLDGEHCETNMNGLYLLDGDQHIDNQTMVDHKKPNSYSNELYKGILGGKATGVFNGKIFVRQDAQKTNAFQSNKNILLSDEATVNTKPQLEIWADDVKCSHGATTGQLDQEQLFYLRSRGINKQDAKSLLLYAFAVDALESIKVDAVKQYIDENISRRLNQNT